MRDTVPTNPVPTRPVLNLTRHRYKGIAVAVAIVALAANSACTRAHSTTVGFVLTERSATNSVVLLHEDVGTGTKYGTIGAQTRCSPDEKLIGGGYAFYGAGRYYARISVFENYPIDNGWQVTAAIPASLLEAGLNAFAYAQCLKAPPGKTIKAAYPYAALTFDASDQATSSCPAGATATGGGFSIAYPSTSPLNLPISAVGSYPSRSGSSWRGEFHRSRDYHPGESTLTGNVYAACVDLTSLGIQSAWASSNIEDTTLSAVALATQCDPFEDRYLCESVLSRTVTARCGSGQLRAGGGYSAITPTTDDTSMSDSSAIAMGGPHSTGPGPGGSWTSRLQLNQTYMRSNSLGTPAPDTKVTLVTWADCLTI